MSEQVPIVGPAGMIVAKNLERLRGAVSYADLSRRLKFLGHEIAPLGLRRIEAGARKVSTDDLIALAIVLDVSPLALLLPSSEDGESQVEYLPSWSSRFVMGESLKAGDIWLWFGAERRLGLPGADGSFGLFRARSIPDWLDARFALRKRDGTNGDD